MGLGSEHDNGKKIFEVFTKKIQHESRVPKAYKRECELGYTQRQSFVHGFGFHSSHRKREKGEELGGRKREIIQDIKKSNKWDNMNAIRKITQDKLLDSLNEYFDVFM